MLANAKKKSAQPKEIEKREHRKIAVGYNKAH